jgi:ABC-2 type transport system permease protein
MEEAQAVRDRVANSLAVARDPEKGVFQRLRVTPASTLAIMGSRLIIQVLTNLIIARCRRDPRRSDSPSLAFRRPVRTGPADLHPGRHHVPLHRTGAGCSDQVLETVNSTARLLYIGLILLGLLGQGGSLGNTWDGAARWSPVGTVMTLFAAVLNLSDWNAHDLESLLAAVGYVVVFAVVGIRGSTGSNTRRASRQST